MNIYWLFLIIRIMYRYVAAGVAKDERSDDEDEESDSQEEIAKTKKEE